MPSANFRVRCRNGKILTMDKESRLLIRDEQPPDGKQVREVNEAAFGRSDEADLIDMLRVEGGHPAIACRTV